MKLCPCGSNKAYDLCCGAFITGQTIPPTPEALMRSRYTAYTLAELDYIVATMKPPAAKGFNLEEARAWTREVKWLGLEVLFSQVESHTGYVIFRASYLQANKKQLLEECSEFRLEEGRWYYIDGKVPVRASAAKISRNEPCPCGSQKKYKKCCGQGKV